MQYPTYTTLLTLALSATTLAFPAPANDEDIGDSLWVNYVRMKLFNMKTLHRAESTRDLYHSPLLESSMHPNPAKLKLFPLLDAAQSSPGA